MLGAVAYLTVSWSPNAVGLKNDLASGLQNGFRSADTFIPRGGRVKRLTTGGESPIGCGAAILIYLAVETSYRF